MTCTGAGHQGATKTLWLTQNLTGIRLSINPNVDGFLTAVPGCGVEETHLVSVLGRRLSLIAPVVFLRRPNRCTASSLSPAPAWLMSLCVCVEREKRSQAGITCTCACSSSRSSLALVRLTDVHTGSQLWRSGH